MGRQFTDDDRVPLSGTVILDNGEALDVTGAILSEEGHVAPGDPSTRSRQCRLRYYKLPEGSFVCRTRHAGTFTYEWKVHQLAGAQMCKTRSAPVAPSPVQRVHVLNGPELRRVEA